MTQLIDLPGEHALAVARATLAFAVGQHMQALQSLEAIATMRLNPADRLAMERRALRRVDWLAQQVEQARERVRAAKDVMLVMPAPPVILCVE